jgi:hypothetical protein
VGQWKDFFQRIKPLLSAGINVTDEVCLLYYSGIDFLGEGKITKEAFKKFAEDIGDADPRQPLKYMFRALDFFRKKALDVTQIAKIYGYVGLPPTKAPADMQENFGKKKELSYMEVAYLVGVPVDKKNGDPYDGAKILMKKK